MAEQWYYSRDNKNHGPISGQELQQLAQKGQLLESDLIWKEGMPEWKAAKNYPILFKKSGPQSDNTNFFEDGTEKNKGVFSDPNVKIIGDGIEKATQGSKKFFEKIGQISDKVGDTFGEATNSDGNTNQSAIFLEKLYFGGRTRIGSSLSVCDTLGGKMCSVLFGLIYLVPILYFSCSSWQFLPYSKTDLVRINLRQKLRWERIFPIFVSWILYMSIGGLICLFWLMISIAILLASPLFGAILVIAVIPFSATISILANLKACKKIAILKNHTRSSINLEYGFPNKTQLLIGESDLPVEKQLENVLALCEAIAKANFSPWEIGTANRNMGIRNQLASLIRRFIGQ